MKARNCFIITAFCITLTASVALAQTRTTPVEVKNAPTVNIDSTNNTVKAQQSGTWDVGLTGSPIVKIDPTTNAVKIDSTANIVQAQQLGPWNFDFSGSPTVKIDPNNNAVTTTTLSKTVQLWSNTDIPNANSTTTVNINCAGYKEARVVVGSNSNSASLKVFPGFVNNGNGLALGFCSFGVVTTRGIVNSSAYSCSANVCAFTLPVMSDTLTLYIKNDTGSSVNISNSWVYLVN